MSKLILVCGEPGVGKSKIASHLSKKLGGRVLRTDEIRKELFGPEPDYSTEESRKVYDAMFERADVLLQQDYTVILDATFMLQKGRERANHLAQVNTDPYDFTIIRVTAEPSVVKERIRERGEDSASDADVRVYQSIRDRFEEVELPHVTIDNSHTWFETRKQLWSKDLYAKPSYYT